MRHQVADGGLARAVLEFGKVFRDRVVQAKLALFEELHQAGCRGDDFGERGGVEDRIRGHLFLVRDQRAPAVRLAIQGLSVVPCHQDSAGDLALANGVLDGSIHGRGLRGDVLSENDGGGGEKENKSAHKGSFAQREQRAQRNVTVEVMADTLARLRMNLEFMPSPVEDRPGLLIRDSYHYSDAALIVPPPLVECLQCFDGEHTDLDLRAALVRITGDLQIGEVAKQLIDTLHVAGFLEDEVYQKMKEERETEFAEALVREPVHAGAAYPAEAGRLTDTLREYMDGSEKLGTEPDFAFRNQAPSPISLLGIAAPHVSPEGGWECYRAAYQAARPDMRERVFVVLGTSHYGAPDRFGLTRKPFETPLGLARTDTALVDRLAADPGAAIGMEDYCHSVEHSIEFQVLFLQHLYGPDVRILPILCGTFARSLYRGGMPEDDEGVRRFLAALGEMAAREGERLFWVLGIDMAHMGRRYGDHFTARTDEDRMLDVAERDRLRIASVAEGDSQGFWEQVKENQDDLKWCGSAPLYTFLKAVPQARGELLRYQQWNIDDHSVVSFGAMGFRGRSTQSPVSRDA